MSRTTGRSTGCLMGSQSEEKRDLDTDDSELIPADEVTLGNPYHLSRGVRTLFKLIAVILVVSMTALFFRGFIHW